MTRLERRLSRTGQGRFAGTPTPWPSAPLRRHWRFRRPAVHIADWLNQSPKECRPPGGGPANYAERCQSGQSTDRGEGLCLELWRHRRPVVHCVAGGFNTSPTPRHGCRVAALPNLMQWAVNQSIQQTRAHKLFVSVWKLLNFEQRETPRLAPGDLEDQPFHADSWLAVHISKSVGILVGSPSFVGSSPARNPTEVYATDSML